MGTFISAAMLFMVSAWAIQIGVDFSIGFKISAALRWGYEDGF